MSLYEWENRNVLRRYRSSDVRWKVGVCWRRKLGRLAADSRQTNWRYCQTMGGRGQPPLSWRYVGETSETWLQISRHSAVEDQMDSCGCSWAVTRMLWSTDKVRAEPSQDRAYIKRF